MRIAVTADNHIQHLTHPELSLRKLMDDISAENVEALCVAGDIGEGNQFGFSEDYDLLLGSHRNTMFILGNHDLWTNPRAPLTPPEAMTANLRRFRKGILLEQSWDDRETVQVIGDCVFIGCMGFPDFAHPRLTGKKEFYNRRSATMDSQFMNLSKGWLVYTERMHSAFAQRLRLAFATNARSLIVLTHYPIFEGQSALRDESGPELQVWPYFFNWTMGRMVLAKAKKHPDKNVWCMAGHSHEYCKGTLTREADNVRVYGLKASYGRQDFFVFESESTLR